MAREIRLAPLADGRTLVEGRTWYAIDIWPQWFWAPWADGVVYRIQRRVLRHVRAPAERDASWPAAMDPDVAPLSCRVCDAQGSTAEHATLSVIDIKANDMPNRPRPARVVRSLD